MADLQAASSPLVIQEPSTSVVWKGVLGVLELREGSGRSLVLVQPNGSEQIVDTWAGENSEGQVFDVAVLGHRIIYSVVWSPEIYSSSWTIFAYDPTTVRAPIEIAAARPNSDGNIVDGGAAWLETSGDAVLWTQVLDGDSTIASLMAASTENGEVWDVVEVQAGTEGYPIAGSGETVVVPVAGGYQAFADMAGTVRPAPIETAIPGHTLAYLRQHDEPNFLAIGDEASVVIADNLQSMRVWNARGEFLEVPLDDWNAYADFPQVVGDKVTFGLFLDVGRLQGPAILDVATGVTFQLFEDGGLWLGSSEETVVGHRGDGNKIEYLSVSIPNIMFGTC